VGQLFSYRIQWYNRASDSGIDEAGRQSMSFAPWMPFFAPRIHFPGSGDLDLAYSPYTKWEAPSLYRGNDRIEQAVYTSVASPGSQLGTIIDLLDQLADKEGTDTQERQKLKLLKERVDKTKMTFFENDEADALNALERLKSRDLAGLDRVLAKFNSQSSSE
jgi:hypothetical protein